MKKILLIISTLSITLALSACTTEYKQVESSPEFNEEANVCYQIFPISYADSSGDGYGDLRGIADNVEYLSETLDVDCVWLNPFNPSTTYHKYDVTDYYDIDEDLGTMEDFEYFMKTLNDNDIYVLMDLVINHSSYHHPWFQESRSDESSDKRDWYSWNDLDDRTAFPSTDGWYAHGDSHYYGSFWDQMPEFNYENQDVRNEMHTIAEFWLEKGVDGFRIDAARHIYDVNQYPRDVNVTSKSTEWFVEFNHYVKSTNPNAFIVGEVWTDNYEYVANFYDGMDSNFNFQFSTDIVDVLKNGRDNELIENLLASHKAYDEVREDYIDSIFITNHDQNRIMSEVSHDIDKAKQAAHILFTLPGISWIYYGEELGMTGVKPDPQIRQPFIWGEDSAYNTIGSPTGARDYNHIQSWDNHNENLEGVKEQLDDNDSLLNTYRELISLKQNHSAIHNGELEAIESNRRLLSYTMSDEHNDYLIVHNLSQLEQSFIFDFTYRIVHQSHRFIDLEQTITMQPLSSIILDIDSGEVVINP